jgi:hypothetical protein
MKKESVSSAGNKRFSHYPEGVYVKNIKLILTLVSVLAAAVLLSACPG